jgi:hypothetical protein
VGRDALVIGRYVAPGTEAALHQYFKSVEELPSFSFGRSGMKEVELRIILAQDLLNPIPRYYPHGGN